MTDLDPQGMCTLSCWMPVQCPDHGDPMPPRESDPADHNRAPCCGNWLSMVLNPRHLWSIHDNARWFIDPEGWNQHADGCHVGCRPYPERGASD